MYKEGLEIGTHACKTLYNVINMYANYNQNYVIKTGYTRALRLEYFLRIFKLRIDVLRKNNQLSTPMYNLLNILEIGMTGWSLQ